MNENMGTLIFNITAGDSSEPIKNARIVVTSQTDSSIRYVLTTDESGVTKEISLPAPDKSTSLSPNRENPYYKYNARIEADGYIPTEIRGIEIFEGIKSISQMDMEPYPKDRQSLEIIYNIPGNALEFDTPRNPENPVLDERILKDVIIPTYITVHLGAPNNNAVSNITVNFVNYIKNVASSEIYPTWPENALRANILAQISFALNRVYTEWYTSRGYPFNITNNTAYDQYYVPGRNIYENISKIVDEIFNNYVVKGQYVNPYFTEYCSGSTVTCNGMSQWGTVTLSNSGYTPLAILQYYYGSDIRVTSTNRIQNIPSSYPGTALRVGSRSSDVRTVQRYLNRIARNYPAIPTVSADGVFGTNTENAVKAFQRIFNLTPDGIVGRTTWNKISYIFAAVTKIAELGGEGITIDSASSGNTISLGSRGNYVKIAQNMLRKNSLYFPTIPTLTADGIFGEKTRQAVIAFQKYFGLTPDGVIGRRTWNMLYDVFLGTARQEGFNVSYPGTPLKLGSRGENVWLMQSYLNTIGEVLNIPKVITDSIFGARTEAAVKTFQQLEGLTPDGIIGRNTWDRIIALRLAV